MVKMINDIRKYFFKVLFIFFRERAREGEREGEKHQCVFASHSPPTGDLAHNPGMFPDWESNQRPLGSQSGTQSTEPRQPGHALFFLSFSSLCLNLKYSEKGEEPWKRVRKKLRRIWREEFADRWVLWRSLHPHKEQHSIWWKTHCHSPPGRTVTPLHAGRELPIVRCPGVPVGACLHPVKLRWKCFVLLPV